MSGVAMAPRRGPVVPASSGNRDIRPLTDPLRTHEAALVHRPKLPAPDVVGVTPLTRLPNGRCPATAANHAEANTIIRADNGRIAARENASVPTVAKAEVLRKSGGKFLRYSWIFSTENYRPRRQPHVQFANRLLQVFGSEGESQRPICGTMVRNRCCGSVEDGGPSTHAGLLSSVGYLRSLQASIPPARRTRRMPLR